MIKASNASPSIEPSKFIDVSTFFTDIVPDIETFLPRLLGVEPLALEPFSDWAYNLTLARFTPDSSINIKLFKFSFRICCQNSYRRFCTLSRPLADGKTVFFFESHVQPLCHSSHCSSTDSYADLLMQ
jgi:hypothetical protein